MARARIDTPEGLTRAIGSAASLGLFAALPTPSAFEFSTAWNVFLIFQFLGLGLLAWSSWFRDDLVLVSWIFVFVLASVGFVKFGGIYVPLMLVLWGVWRVVRYQRSDHLKKTLVLVVGFMLIRQSRAQEPVVDQPPPSTAPALSSPLMSFPKPKDFQPTPAQQSSAIKLPKYLTGFTLRDITSCGQIDQIPWKFRKDGKKSRMILKDKLRYMNQTTFLDWSLFQILDAQGFVSFVFRRATSSGRYESLVLKDTIFNRVVDTKDGPKTVESQDLKTLINRPAIAFYSQDGSTINFSPSADGNSMITFQQSAASSRLLPPVFIRGNVCDRPEDEEDSDRLQRQSVRPTAPAATKAPGG